MSYWAYSPADAELVVQVVTKQPIVRVTNGSISDPNPTNSGVVMAMTLELQDGSSVPVSFPLVFVPNGNPALTRAITYTATQNGTNSFILTFTLPGTFPFSFSFFLFLFLFLFSFSLSCYHPVNYHFHLQQDHLMLSSMIRISPS